MQQRHQRRVTGGRQREALELRDACLLLAARHGAQREGGARRWLEVRHGDAANAPVLELRWSGEGLEVVAFRRGTWEAELLGLAGRGSAR